MADSAPQVFEDHATGYDAQRRRLIPPFDAFYGTAVAATGLNGPPKRILDLGAGTGLLSRKLAAAYPDAELTLLDAAPAMLAAAEAALGTRATYVTADLTDPLPEPGEFDAIVSALAIHHLDHDDKRALFARIAQAAPLFVNAEQVAGPSKTLDDLYRTWHRDSALRAGATEQDWAAAEERMRFDVCASVEDQLIWMRDAGFPNADCLFKDHRFAVLVSYRQTECAAASAP